MKDENFYVIHGWMINRLRLKGKELMLYAIIYGFAQAPGTKYTGSISYLATCIGSSSRSVIRALNDLCERGLIIKEQTEVNNVKFNEYTAVVPEATITDNRKDISEDELSEMLQRIKNI